LISVLVLAASVIVLSEMQLGVICGRPNFAYVSYGSEADINGMSALPAKADIDHVKFDVG